MDAPPASEAPPEEPTTAADATASPQPRPIRRLSRSSDDRVIAGVAAGIAEYYGIEPLLVRLGFVAASFFGGIGVVAYIVAWIVLPAVPSSVGLPVRRVDTQQLLGFGLVALGLAVVPGSLGFGIGGGAFWPVALIAIGVAVLWLRTGESRSKPSTGGGPSTSAPPPTAPVPAAAAETAPPLPPPPAPPPAAPPAAAGTAPIGPTPRPPRPRSYVSAITFSALLILAGGAWLVDLSGIADVDVAVVFAVALAVVGIALVASAWYGRARGLIVLGILLAFVVAGFGVIDVPLRGGIGDPTYRPHALAAVDRSYELAIGKMVIDLRGVDFSGHRRSVHAAVGIGDLDVLVPTSVRVVVDGHAGAGSVSVFGRRTQTCCPTDTRRVSRGVGGAGTLRIDAEVGAGTAEIKR